MDPGSIYEELSQNNSQGQYKSQENKVEKPRSAQTQQFRPTRSFDNTKSKPKNSSKMDDKIKFPSNNGENMNEKEIQQKIENFKMQQNHEMLVVLEEEQDNEANREEAMKKITDPKEKKRLEKIFGMERAKAQARIQEISEYNFLFI